MSSSGIQQKGVLANRVAVVTGATDGIGFAIARRLAQDGAHVVVSSRKQQNVDRAVAVLQGEGLSVTGTVCHVGKAEDRERLVATDWVSRTRAEILTPTVRVPCRIGQPEDCAGIVSFLCSPDASYITGENIVVAGFSPRL
ncbi:PREDICTED: dehydrogenase/reductase SDR family member 2, mitochondrial isoform X6 [Condylura cristata]|uniref:dehydrogenase/reductase SDR family member 2, mitochondrial isoform X6 n=1 Tax=Condylura cristata TaxID=143302 RepID=UPI000643BE34|nr:PREDICTED: dehydrogenase/reductase SDR family member 2, mitochondrial isoform X6 [Condylura cristata]